MSTSKKTSYTSEFKSRVALEAIRSDKTVNDLAQEFNVASSLVSKWKKLLLANASSAFEIANKTVSDESKDKQLYEQIGKLSMEVDYLKKFANRCH